MLVKSIIVHMPVNSCIYSLWGYKGQSSPEVRNWSIIQWRCIYLFIVFKRLLPNSGEKQHDYQQPLFQHNRRKKVGLSGFQLCTRNYLASFPGHMVWEQDWCDHSRKNMRWVWLTKIILCVLQWSRGVCTVPYITLVAKDNTGLVTALLWTGWLDAYPRALLALGCPSPLSDLFRFLALVNVIARKGREIYPHSKPLSLQLSSLVEWKDQGVRTWDEAGETSSIYRTPYIMMKWWHHITSWWHHVTLP